MLRFLFYVYIYPVTSEYIWFCFPEFWKEDIVKMVSFNLGRNIFFKKSGYRMEEKLVTKYLPGAESVTN